MRKIIVVVVLLSLLFGRMPGARAMTPPQPKTLDERVEMASHVIVGTGKSVQIVRWKNGVPEPAEPEPKMLDLGQSAKIEIEVNEVLYPMKGFEKKVITYWLGGGMFGVDTIRNDFIGKKWIFIMQATRDKPDQEETFVTSYGWNFMESLSSRDGVMEALRHKAQRAAQRRAAAKKELSELAMPATHTVVATAKQIRVLTLKDGLVVPVSPEPGLIFDDQWVEIELEVNEVISAPTPTLDGPLLVKYDERGQGIDSLRKDLLGQKKIYLLKQMPADKAAGLPVKYLPAARWNSFQPVEKLELMKEIATEKKK